MAVIKCQVSTAGDHQKRIILPNGKQKQKQEKTTSDDYDNDDGGGVVIHASETKTNRIRSVN